MLRPLLFCLAIFEIGAAEDKGVLGWPVQTEGELVISRNHMRTNRETPFILEYLHSVAID
jgi:hypothetical protein